MLHPVILWKNDDKYIILSGHNRIRVLKTLGYDKLDESMYILKENLTTLKTIKSLGLLGFQKSENFAMYPPLT